MRFQTGRDENWISISSLNVAFYRIFVEKDLLKRRKMLFFAINATEPKEREDNTHLPGYKIHFHVNNKTFMRGLQGLMSLSSLVSSPSLILATKSSAARRPVKLKAAEREPQGLSFIFCASEKILRVSAISLTIVGDRKRRENQKHSLQMLRNRFWVLKQKRLSCRVE